MCDKKNFVEEEDLDDLLSSDFHDSGHDSEEDDCDDLCDK
jgi:hypothetical protein